MLRILLVSFCLCAVSLHAGWLERKAEGWAWYEDKIQEEKPENAALQKQSPTEILGQAKKELEERLAEAIIEPSEENIVAYILLQKKWLNQSTKFSDEWARVLLDHPELDPTAFEFPVSHYGRQVSRDLEESKKERRIKDLSRSYGLVCFYEGGSRVSQAFSLVVQQFSEKYQWAVSGVSCDGVLLEGYEHNYPDRGIAQAFGLNRYPALFVVDPQSQEAVPVSFGLATLEKIEDNLALRFPEEKEGFDD
ncbi:MAG: type-F conjugative transfer system pilin assembly protein TraF [Waddliaceae bacterium]